MNRRIGMTTTIPVEIVYAAGHTPVDLNNIFITADNRESMLKQAEESGFPTGVCAWIKGIYAAASRGSLDAVVSVVHGDCANTIALGEVWRHRGTPVIEFAFPYRRDRERLAASLKRFADELGATADDIAWWKRRLDAIRRHLVRLDEMTWKQGRVTGNENHLWLVNSSDFYGDPDRFERELLAFLEEAEQRPERVDDDALRIGVLGVPTILDDLYDNLEQRGARVVFNEVQRQFSMPSMAPDLVEQYMNYTYPFDLPFRSQDILAETKQRKLDGLVHYIQSFCHRQIEDIVLREVVDVPVTTIEGDRPGPMDGRTMTRLDAFLEMLRER